MIKSGFFNSDNGDRMYSADDINDFFQGFVTEGVLSPVGGWFQVTAGTGMSVSVADGKAWFLNTYIVNTSPYTLYLPQADPVYPKWVTVVLDFNLTTRENTIGYVEGNPAVTPTKPALFDNATRKQVPLAEIYVVQNETQINQGDITNTIGTEATPWCTGLLQQATMDDILAQWESEFYAWQAQVENDLEEIDLTGTLAELSSLRMRTPASRNLLINGDMRINQRNITTVTGVNKAYTDVDRYPGIADRWAVEVGNTSGTWSLAQTDLTGDMGAGLHGWKMTVTSSGNVSDGAAIVVLRQRMEGQRLGPWFKGRAGGLARPLVLRWWMRTNVAGTFIVELTDAPNNRSISKAYSQSGSAWNVHEWAIPADAVGTIPNTNALGATLNFWFAAGNNYKSGGSLQTTWGPLTTNKRAYGLTNLAASIGNFVEITDVQLEIGDTPTLYDRQPLDEALRECRRYREFYTSWITMGRGQATGSKVHVYGEKFDVPKRDLPTYQHSAITVLDNSTWWSATNFALTNPTESFQKERPYFSVVNGAAVTDAKIYQVDISNFLIDAELPG